MGGNREREPWRLEGERGMGGGKGKGGTRERNAKRFFFKFNNASEYFQNIFDSHFTSSQSLLRLSSK